jgi:ABC-type dipeptide/oligopeptide/nickel transport system permease component
MAMTGEQATREARNDCMSHLGLDRPLVVQYGDYLWKSIRLDFGSSLRQHEPVTNYVLRLFPYTLVLLLASMVMALALGLPNGIRSALHRRHPLIDHSARWLTWLGLSMPVFWCGMLLLIAFSLYWDLFPLIGGGDLPTVLDMLVSGEVFQYPEDFLAAVVDVLHHLALPAFALGSTLAGTISRLSRSAMLETIGPDFVRTVRTRGLPERLVIYTHALRRMLMPLLTIIGAFMAVALTGTVLTETVFARPGLGKLLVDAIGARDYPLAQGALTVFAMTIMLVHLIVDILYAVFEPRIV